MSYGDESDGSKAKRKERPDLSYLNLTIRQASDPLTIEAVITNTHATTSFSVLDWDTPINPRAFSFGIFSMRRLGDEDNVMLGRDLRARRLMPISRSSIVEIGPCSSAIQQHTIPIQYFPLESGQTYKIRAAGFYKAVWPVKVEEITDKELMSPGRSRRSMSSNFKSNEIEILVP